MWLKMYRSRQSYASAPMRCHTRLCAGRKIMSEFIETVASPDQVLSFWFDELTPKDWFQPDDVAALDNAILYRFFATHRALARDVDGAWRATPEAQISADLTSSRVTSGPVSISFLPAGEL